MGKSLVIVESPAKARTINKFLGSDYVVKPTGGHIIDLPEDDFGIDIENGFKPKYTVIKGKRRILQDLKRTAREADTVLLATDPDREGEAIAWHVANRIVGEEQPSYRVLINQITKDAVVNAVRNKGELDLKKVYAQQARRILDRLVGYKVSPVLWSTIYKGLSAGRVQSVALRLIVERDEEIESFVPEEYWKIAVLLATEEKREFTARLVKKSGKKISLGNSREAEAVKEELSGLDFIVRGVSKKKTKKNPTPPFITSTLQQAAAGKLGFPVAKTMSIAQALYEGVELEDGSTGLITYMRTDSTRVAPEAVEAARSYIAERWGKEHLPAKANVYRTRKGAQDAHEAIRPASMSRPPESVKRFLTRDQFRLYSLIWNKFVASQMKPAEFTNVTVDVAAGPYEFRATASHLDYRGYLMAYEEEVKQENGEEESPVPELPELRKDERLELREVRPTQHFTKPPPAYTEATLVKELESRGIGRPSTYAQIINTILTRKYVEKDRGKLRSTELGRKVNSILVGHLESVFNVGFTANMEEELDRIEAGEYDWTRVVKDFYEPFNESLERLERRKDELRESMIERTDEVCEKCGRPMVIRWGRGGKFMACTGFPACRNTKPLNAPEPEKTGEVCDKCGSPMVVKTGKYGRFLACSNYPKCRNIKPYPLGVKCPVEGCDGEIVEKRSKKGRLFYGCSRYPDCRFASWNKPVAVTCPECGCPTLIESKDGGSYSCPRCKHEFEREEVEKVGGG